MEMALSQISYNGDLELQKIFGASDSGDQQISVSDSASANDNLNISANFIVSDVGNGVFVGFESSTATIEIDESGSSVDNLSIDNLIQLNDNAFTSSSLIIQMPETIINVSDIANGVTFISLNNEFSINDISSGDDDIDSLTAQSTVFDEGSGNDSLSQILASLNVLDTGTIDEVVSITIGYFEKLVNINDSGTGLESFSINVENTTISDEGNSSDSISLSEALISISDTGNGLDLETISNILIVLNELANSSESFSISSQTSVSDITNSQDNFNIEFNILVSDTSQTEESISLSPISITVSDNSIASELTDVIKNKIVNISDSATAVENLSAFVENISVTDEGHISTDFSINTIDINILDDGRGVSDTVIRTEVDINDAGSGSDSISSLLKQTIKRVVDSGQGLSDLTVEVDVPLTDNGRAEELTQIYNTLSTIEDEASGVDSISVTDTSTNVAKIEFKFGAIRAFQFRFRT